MNKKDYQKQSLNIISKLDLEEVDKDLLIQNWVSYLYHLESKITKNYRLSNWLSIVGIIGGISIPAISAFKADNFELIVSIIGIITASSIAINQKQKHSEKWRHFRKMVELARIEGELFLSLAGENYNKKSHSEAFPIFMAILGKLKGTEINSYFDNLDGLIKGQNNQVKITETK